MFIQKTHNNTLLIVKLHEWDYFKTFLLKANAAATVSSISA